MTYQKFAADIINYWIGEYEDEGEALDELGDIIKLRGLIVLALLAEGITPDDGVAWAAAQLDMSDHIRFPVE